MLDCNRLFDPWQLEELAPSELFLSDRQALCRPAAQYTLQVARLRLQPCLNELCRVPSKRFEKDFLHMRVVQ